MGEPVTFLLVLLVMAVAFVFANIGLGGGLLYVPILLAATEYPKEVVVPISLALVVATGISAAANHHRRGLVEVPLAALLIGGALAGAVLGVLFNLAIDHSTFVAVFAVVLFLMGGKMLWDWHGESNLLEDDDDSKLTPPRRASATAATLGSGFASGTLGIGGGLVNVPLMVYVLGRNTRLAIGTSSLMIVFTAAFGLITYVSVGVLEGAHYTLIAFLFPAAILGSFIGSRWGLRRLRTRSVALILILVIFIAAGKMALDLLPS